MDQYMQTPEAPPPRGFSLAALFLLLTTAGVVAALARNASLHAEWPNWQLNGYSTLIVAHVAIGSVIGGAVGFFVGLSYKRRGRGCLIGSGVGVCSGGLCAGIAAAGASLWMFFFGSLTLIALGTLARLNRRRLTPLAFERNSPAPAIGKLARTALAVQGGRNFGEAGASVAARTHYVGTDACLADAECGGDRPTIRRITRSCAQDGARGRKA